MTADFEWDCTVLTPAIAGPPQLMAMNTVGGRTFNNLQQIVMNSAGYWRMDYGGIAVNTAEQIRAWNALQAGTQGRGATILVPILDELRGPTITAHVTADVAIGDTSALIRVDGNLADLEPGQHFGVPTFERLFRITKINSHSADSGGAENWNVDFLPPARERIPDGTALEFQDVKFRCRLASDDAMAGLSLGMWKFGNGPSVSFIEDV